MKTLSGTGLLNDTTFVFNGVCSNCRSWSRNGNLDVSSTSQEMAYATGPSGDTMSDNPRESVKIHESYGSFSMDLARATGTGGVPEIPASENVTSVGAVQQLSKTGYVDKRAILHAVFMIFAFVGIWPFGILVLRVGGSVRWHGINQAVAFGLVLIGAILGFVISTSYNRVSSHANPTFGQNQESRNRLGRVRSFTNSSFRVKSSIRRTKSSASSSSSLSSPNSR